MKLLPFPPVPSELRVCVCVCVCTVLSREQVFVFLSSARATSPLLSLPPFLPVVCRDLCSVAEHGFLKSPFPLYAPLIRGGETKERVERKTRDGAKGSANESWSGQEACAPNNRHFLEGECSGISLSLSLSAGARSRHARSGSGGAKGSGRERERPLSLTHPRLLFPRGLSWNPAGQRGIFGGRSHSCSWRPVVLSPPFLLTHCPWRWWGPKRAFLMRHGERETHTHTQETETERGGVELSCRVSYASPRVPAVQSESGTSPVP
ncbi:hypothetical protein LY76DRAFT_186934 [Colletotrichum caudatum]|nr:hypothetical protein LY76DRAFT_186934 [Colletotrichum caudatum]